MGTTLRKLSEVTGVPVRTLHRQANDLGLFRWMEPVPDGLPGRRRYRLSPQTAETLALLNHLRRNLGVSPQVARRVAEDHLRGEVKGWLCFRAQRTHTDHLGWEWKAVKPAADGDYSAVINVKETLRHVREMLEGDSQ